MDPQDLRQELTQQAQGPEDFSPSAGPGLYLNVPEEAYFEHEALSRSTLATCAQQSPLHAAYMHRADDDSGSDSMDIGTALHARVLEPDTFDSRFDVAPDQCEALKADGDPCSYAAKYRHGGSWYCGTHAPEGEPDDIEVLKSSHFYTVQGMHSALKSDPDARPVLYQLPGIEEATIVFRDDQTGLKVKARPDRIACLPGRRVSIIDIKTTRSAHPADFRRSYSKFGYWLQPAVYSAAVNRAGVDVDVVDFVFTCVEKKPPYAVQCYRPAANDDDGARRRLAGLLSSMSDALEGDAPGYRSGVAEIAMKRYEKDRLGISA